jgi:hypothetical protein
MARRKSDDEGDIEEPEEEEETYEDEEEEEEDEENEDDNVSCVLCEITCTTPSLSPLNLWPYLLLATPFKTKIQSLH